ncbi:flagellar hook-length control protein FliK [Sphingomonas flavalba]|uniref:flagellar hook-length control protein FliK n=1 Tax=Sphingomonas flavalba TaxID=2559804 RepID=UPI00109E26C2|nr:flagellar hook-length control protein FliK [Sphingomonas flavalba]
MSLLAIQTAGPPAQQPAIAVASAGGGDLFAALVAGLTGADAGPDAAADGKPVPVDRQEAADPATALPDAEALLAMIDTKAESADPAPADDQLRATLPDAAVPAETSDADATPVACGWTPVKAFVPAKPLVALPAKPPTKMPAPVPTEPTEPTGSGGDAVVADARPETAPAASDAEADAPADPPADPAMDPIVPPPAIAAPVMPPPVVDADPVVAVTPPPPTTPASVRTVLPLAVPVTADPVPVAAVAVSEDSVVADSAPVEAKAPPAAVAGQPTSLPRQRAPGAAPTTSAARASSIPASPPRSDAAAAQMLAALVTGDSGDRAETERAGDAFAQALGGIRATLTGAPPRVEPPVAVLRAPPLDTGRAEWIEALVDRIDAQRAEGSRIAHLKLRPDALGGVEVRIRHDGDRIHVAFATETAQARSLLADAAPRLAELADARGLKLGDTGVQQQDRQASDQRRTVPERIPAAPAPAAVAPATDDAGPSGRIA